MLTIYLDHFNQSTKTFYYIPVAESANVNNCKKTNKQVITF